MDIKSEEFPKYRCLLTEAPLNPLKNKELMAEIIFEKLKISEFNIEPQAKLSLIAEGRSSGIVLDSGDGVTHCIPIYENNILSHYIKRIGIAGRHITSRLIELLQLK
jgi:actin-related protein 2